MNIALSAVVLVLILLPGVAAIRSYYSAIKDKASTIHLPFADVLFKGLLVSFASHLIGIYFVTHNTNQKIDFELLYNVLIGEKISEPNLQTKVVGFLIYNLATIIVVFVITKIFKYGVRKFDLDLKYNFLQNTNYWFQIFSGRFLDEQGHAKEATDLIIVDVLSKGNTLFTGILVDFHWSPHKDSLEGVVLTSVIKRNVCKPSDEKKITMSEGSRIPGEIFVIPAASIENINVYYTDLTDVELPVMTGDESVE